MNNNTIVEDFGNTSKRNLFPSYCGVSDKINEQFTFWIEGVLLSVVGLLGVAGNMVTFYVLSRIRTKHNIFNKLLMQLVSGESISIILVFIDFSLRRSFELFHILDVAYVYLWPYFMYPFIKISNTWIMCCTIAITIERYVQYFGCNFRKFSYLTFFIPVLGVRNTIFN